MQGICPNGMNKQAFIYEQGLNLNANYYFLSTKEPGSGGGTPYSGQTYLKTDSSGTSILRGYSSEKFRKKDAISQL